MDKGTGYLDVCRYRLSIQVLASQLQLQRAMRGCSIGSCCAYSTAFVKATLLFSNGGQSASPRDRRGRRETVPGGFVRQPKPNS